MWNMIFDSNGNWRKPNGQPYDVQAFIEAMRRPHETTAKIELLTETVDADGHIILKEVEGGTIFSADRTNELTNFITDGSIDVDSTRLIRRTGELTLLNPTAEFTPATEDFESEGPWVGKVYLDRIVRCWKGLYIGEQPFYVPVGTMMIDIADVVAEQNMSLVTLTMSDRAKKMAKSFFGKDVVYDKGTLYNTIITDLLEDCGIPVAGNYRAILDSLADRDPADRRTTTKVSFKQGDSRGERLKQLTRHWGIDMYFDPMGRLRTEDRKSAEDKGTVFHYWQGPNDNEGRNGMMVSLKRTFNDDRLYNHVIIVGTGGADDKSSSTPKVVRVHKMDDNPRSKTSIDRIGDRVYLLESDKISTEAEANRALNRAWALRFQLMESIEMQTISNPLLEADDVVRIEERSFVKIDDNYRVQRFDIPFVTSRQTIQSQKIIRNEDL